MCKNSPNYCVSVGNNIILGQPGQPVRPPAGRPASLGRRRLRRAVDGMYGNPKQMCWIPRKTKQMRAKPRKPNAKPLKLAKHARGRR